MNLIYDELIEFNKKRLLHNQEFDLSVASLNILEELLEAHGVGDNDDREITKILYNKLLSVVHYARQLKPELCFETNEHSIIDAFNDIQVYAFGEPLKMGYSPILCMAETSKEINSREGRISNGKFVKYKTERAKSKWYKADYSKAKNEN